ncbi:MAG: ABC transporter substrate-binding protein [Dehalococcoidia bacterium]
MEGNYWERYARRRLSRRQILAGGATLAVGSGALLAGCGDDDDDDEGGSASPAATTAAATGAASATATTATASGETPKRGGTLKWWKAVKDQGLDPAVFHTANAEVTNRMYNHFISYQVSKDLVSKDGVTGWEQPDGTTLIWKLRPNMKFQNGDPVTADDVAYTITRLAAVYKKRGSTHVPTAIFRNIAKVEVVDPLTVKETWTAPNASGLIHKSRHYWAFVNKKLTEAAGGEILDPPDGVAAGPYKLAQRDAQGTKLVRNPDYYKHENPDDGFVVDGPYIDEIQTRIIPDRSAVKGLFETGEIDIFGSMDKLEVAEYKNNKKVVIREIPANSWNPLSFDGAQFLDLRARQAIQKAIDYDGFVATIRAGEAKYRGPVSPATPVWQKLSQDDLKKYWKYDPTAAKQLWQASGMQAPNGQFRMLVVQGNPIGADVADFIKQSLEKTLGIKVVIELNDQQTWVNKATDRSQPTKPWEFLLTGDGIAGGSDGAPENSHISWYDPRGYGLNSFNIHFESPHKSVLDGAKIVGDLVEKQQSQLVKEERVQTITELQKWLLDNAWGHTMMPIASKSYLGLSTRIRDGGFDDWFNDNVYIMRRQAMWLAT